MSLIYNYVISFFYNPETRDPPKITIADLKEAEGTIVPCSFLVSQDDELIKELKQSPLFLKKKKELCT